MPAVNLGENEGALVSVIIPAYNGSQFIERTLVSVCSQTYRNLEILVINDGSTDDTADIAERLARADPRLRVITTANRGVAAARNHGVECAAGDYVAFVDADDLWHPTKIAKQMAALARHGDDESWGAVYTFHRVIDINDYFLRNGSRYAVGGYILARHLVMKFVGNGSSLLVRKKAFWAAGGYEPAYAAAGIGGCEDLDFELRIASGHRVEVVPEMLVGYRSYEGNMSSNRSRMVAGLKAVTENCIAANAWLPYYVKRLARAQSQRYAAEKFALDKRGGQVLRAMLLILPKDPLLFFLFLLEFFVRRKGRDALIGIWYGALKKAPPVRRSYYDFDPAAGASFSWPWFWRYRHWQLEKADKQAENRIFADR